MNHSEFKIDTNFNCGGLQWKCTDVGTRVIVAILISDAKAQGDPSWLNGPPYAVMELVFDEHSMPDCKPV